MSSDDVSAAQDLSEKFQPFVINLWIILYKKVKVCKNEVHRPFNVVVLTMRKNSLSVNKEVALLGVTTKTIFSGIHSTSSESMLSSTIDFIGHLSGVSSKHLEPKKYIVWFIRQFGLILLETQSTMFSLPGIIYLYLFYF